MKYTLATLPLLSTLAMAHPGHDHSAATAPLLHALWIAPVAVAIIGVMFLLRKMFSK